MHSAYLTIKFETVHQRHVPTCYYFKLISEKNWWKFHLSHNLLRKIILVLYWPQTRLWTVGQKNIQTLYIMYLLSSNYSNNSCMDGVWMMKKKRDTPIHNNLYHKLLVILPSNHLPFMRNAHGLLMSMCCCCSFIQRSGIWIMYIECEMVPP